MDNCILCGKEVGFGGYSTQKFPGVILRPLCLECRELADRDPKRIADEHHELIERMVAERKRMLAERSGGTVDAASVASQAPRRSQREETLRKRYDDAYLVSKAAVGIGNAVKVIGILVAVLIGAGTVLLTNQIKGDASLPPLIGGIVTAALVGLICYAFGTLVAAQGQTLKATLDSAVNTSTFLSNELRAKIMSLPSDTTDLAPEKVDFIHCQKCGTTLYPNETACPRCKSPGGKIA